MARAVAGGVWDGKPRRVLICDDERHIVRLLQVNLERRDHHVTVAFEGVECLQLLEMDSFDVLILDAGLDVFPITARHIVQVFEGKIPIILMDTPRSVIDQDDDHWPGPTAGANLLIQKPFNPEEMARWMDRLD